MAVSNRFEQPIATNFQPTYVSQYVPMPTDFIQNSLENKQKQYDEAEAQTYTLQALINNAKSDPATQGIIQAQLDAKYAEPLTALSTELADKGSSDYQARLNAITRQYQTDPLIRLAANNKANYEMELEDKRKNPEKYRDYYSPYQSWVKQNEEAIAKGDLKSVKPFTYSGMKQYEDWTESFDKSMSKIAVDGSKVEAYRTNADGSLQINPLGQYIKDNKSAEGVSELKVYNLAANLAGTMLQGSKGRAFIDETLRKNTEAEGINNDNLYKANVITFDPKTGKLNMVEKELNEAEYVYNEALNQLYTRGLHNVGSVTSNGIDIGNLSSSAFDKAGLGGAPEGGEVSQLPYEEPFTPEEGEKFKKDTGGILDYFEGTNITMGLPASEQDIQNYNKEKTDLENYTFTETDEIIAGKGAMLLGRVYTDDKEGKINLINETVDMLRTVGKGDIIKTNTPTEQKADDYMLNDVESLVGKNVQVIKNGKLENMDSGANVLAAYPLSQFEHKSTGVTRQAGNKTAFAKATQVKVINKATKKEVASYFIEKPSSGNDKIFQAASKARFSPTLQSTIQAIKPAVKDATGKVIKKEEPVNLIVDFNYIGNPGEKENGVRKFNKTGETARLLYSDGTPYKINGVPVTTNVEGQSDAIETVLRLAKLMK